MNAIELNDYAPGTIGRITELHALYYHRHWGFDRNFEAEVARELSDFILAFDQERDFFRTAKADGLIIGSIAIDGKKAETEGARLRWFILSEEYAGKGAGKILMEEAMNFCRRAGHKKIFLWTFRGLEKARNIYEKSGFRLSEEYQDALWGNSIVHQKFIYNL